MSPYRRNVMVGLTVLVALVGLGWMILKFGGRAMTPFQPVRISITFVGTRADGLSEGSSITYRGKQVGQVTSVRLESDLQSVIVEGQVEPPLPENVEGVIRVTSAIGSSSAIMLTTVDQLPAGSIKAGQKIAIRYAGLDLIPPEFAELARDLKETSKQFRESNLIPHLDEQVQRAGKVIDSVQQFIDDPKMKADLQASLENFRNVSENAKTISGKLDKLTDETTETIKTSRTKIDDLSRQMNERMAQVATLLDQTNQISTKINQGEGTAGKLINDPKLYASLVDTTQQLNLTIKDLQRLIQQWEQEGVTLKLK
jgi:phospholipid/cholesterol/gamma-HCH transport system substrate-binding protein